MTLPIATSLSGLVPFLILALVLFIVWLVITKFIPSISWILGLVFGVILLIKALPLLGISS